MDFHTLNRRDLQSLCKKNKIPANLTNVAMADALQSLQTVEGIEELLESLQFSSPKKPELVSPAPPRTSRRTASRRVVGTTRDDETSKGQQASPLPRARRVTARASEVLSLVEGVEEEKSGEKKEGGVPETPMVSTRRRVGKKEGEVEATVAKKSVTTRRRATTTAKKEETEIKKSEDSTTVGVTTRRRATRQSSKKEVEEVTVSVRMTTRRSTRGKAAVKMAALGTNEGEEEEEEEEKKEIVHVNDEKNDVCSEEIVVETREEGDRVAGTEDFADQKNEPCSEEVAAEISKEEVTETKNPLENELNLHLVEDHMDDDVNKTLSGLQDSPVVGLISSSEATPKDEILEHDSLSAENTTQVVIQDGGNSVPELPLTEEIPAENQISRIQLQLIPDNDLTVETMEEVKESGLDQNSPEVMAETMEIMMELMDETQVEEAFENQKSPLPEPNLTVGSVNEVELLEKGSESPHLEIPVLSDQIMGEAIEITVESDESTNNLSYSILVGEIEVEAIEHEVEEVVESQKSPLPEPDLSVEISAGNKEPLEMASEITVKSEEVPMIGAGVYREENEDIDNKENSELVMAGPNGGDKREVKLEDMSLRKLKAAFKEKLVISKNKHFFQEEKRSALQVLDDNCI